MWVGGLACIVFIVVALVVVASMPGLLHSEGALAAIAVQDQTEPPPASAGRTSCAEFGDSDLRSPAEGVWFQGHCAGAPTVEIDGPQGCNRTSLDSADFRLVAPGLYVYRQTQASRAYVWYAGSEACFSLVSSRVVTVICVDHTVSFDWSADACAAHGGVLATVNGR